MVTEGMQRSWKRREWKGEEKNKSTFPVLSSGSVSRCDKRALHKEEGF